MPLPAPAGLSVPFRCAVDDRTWGNTTAAVGRRPVVPATVAVAVVVGGAGGSSGAVHTPSLYAPPCRRTMLHRYHQHRRCACPVRVRMAARTSVSRCCEAHAEAGEMAVALTRGARPEGRLCRVGREARGHGQRAGRKSPAPTPPFRPRPTSNGR